MQERNKMLRIKSWKTTIAGTILLIGAIILFTIDRQIEAGMCLASSFGFFSAKDSNVTGTGTSAKAEDEIYKKIKRGC